MAGLMFYHHEDDRWDEHDVTRDHGDKEMMTVDRLRKAGLAYIVTEYRDVAASMETLAEQRPEYRQRAHRARHTSHVVAYRWAVLNDLPLGGLASIHAAQDDAGAYCLAHRGDVEEFVTMYDHHRSPGVTEVG